MALVTRARGLCGRLRVGQRPEGEHLGAGRARDVRGGRPHECRGDRAERWDAVLGGRWPVAGGRCPRGRGAPPPSRRLGCTRS